MTTNAATDPMIGRMIDQRYRVRSRIARGGMATVYLATDVRLERRVAIKIMHGHLADDQAFRERFIQEARSAARLSHPNLVGVYDQGAEGEIAYIVMEYIPGITLRDLLQEHHALTPEQATDILRAVLAGLASAHRAGIVHRDLKPENVLLADDGRIKLGDFGLARATTANTATGAALLGTIAYLSPEARDPRRRRLAQRHLRTRHHALRDAHRRAALQGRAADADRLPARQRLRAGTECRRVGGAAGASTSWSPGRPHGIPRTVPATPARCSTTCRATSSVRPASTAPPCCAPRTGPRSCPPVARARSAPQRPQHPSGPPEEPPTRPPSSSGPATGTPATAVEHLPVRAATPRPPSDRGTAGRALPAGQRLADQSAKRRKRGWILLSVVVVLALIGAGFGWYFGPGPGGNVRIPEVTGKSVSQARQLLEAQGLQAASKTGTRFDAVVAKGQVSTTKPAAEREVQKGTAVQIVVSNGPRMIPLPAIVGQPLSTVTAALDDDFELQDDRYEFSADAPKDTVVAATGRVSGGKPLDLTTVKAYGETGPVTLTVSLGPVPDVVGKTVDEASAALDDVGLILGARTEEYSESVPAGQIVSAAVQDSPAVRGSAVDVVVSKGPTPITVPEDGVVGATINEATKTLEDLGLKVSVPDCTNILCGFYDWKSKLPVTGTDPGVGATVHRGDTVTLSYDQ